MDTDLHVLSVQRSPLLGYDNYIYIEYIGRKMSFEVSVEKLFKRESISDQHDFKCNRGRVSVILMRVCQTNHVHITIKHPYEYGILVLCTIQ